MAAARRRRLCDFDTPLSEDDSQANNSRNFKPPSLSGDRVQICANVSMFAPSTPTPKNDSSFRPSPSLTAWAACCQLSVGAPSVMRKTQGR